MNMMPVQSIIAIYHQTNQVLGLVSYTLTGGGANRGETCSCCVENVNTTIPLMIDD